MQSVLVLRKMFVAICAISFPEPTGLLDTRRAPRTYTRQRQMVIFHRNAAIVGGRRISMAAKRITFGRGRSSRPFRDLPRATDPMAGQ
jgi:hypothetical protein